jgi:hypothetical protein
MEDGRPRDRNGFESVRLPANLFLKDMMYWLSTHNQCGNQEAQGVYRTRAQVTFNKCYFN